MKPTFAVLGAGSVGCFVGGALAAAGYDVVLVGRARVRDEIDAHGMKLVDVDGNERTTRSARFATEPAAVADRDVILCCVKSAQTAEVADEITGHARRDAVVVSLQNGVSNARDLRARASQPVLGGIVGFNVLSKGDGVFRQATSGELVVENGPRSREIGEALRLARFDVKLVDDIAPLQWAKLVMNLNNAVSALSNAPTREIVFDPGYRRILGALVREALDVMRAAGIRPGRLGAVPVTWFPLVVGLPTPVLRLVARAQLKIDPEARSSMWEDLARGRLTEVEYLNGEIVRLAESRGVDAPLNRRIVALVHEAERAGQGSPRLAADVFWRALTE